MNNDIELNGGRAHINGVSFYSDRFTSKATRLGDTISTDLRKNNKKKTRFMNFLFSIPFVRGIAVLIDVLLQVKKIFMILLGVNILFVYTLSLSLGNERATKTFEFLNIDSVSSYITLIVILLSISAIVVRTTKLGKYHAAEHMVDNARKNGLKLTLDNVLNQSRVHENCGTNVAVFLITFKALLILIVPNQVSGLITTILSWSLAYEVYRADGKVKGIFKPLYLLGYVSQYYFFTSKPSVEEVEVAIESMNALIDAEGEVNETKL